MWEHNTPIPTWKTDSDLFLHFSDQLNDSSVTWVTYLRKMGGIFLTVVLFADTGHVGAELDLELCT